MENLTTKMADGNADDEDESVSSPPQVGFGPDQSTAFRESPRTLTATQLQDELIETTHPDKQTKCPTLGYMA
jgi:hypothetical protein